MTRSTPKLALLCCIALGLAVASTAYADTYSVSGTVWENGVATNGGDTPALGSAIYSTASTATFTLTNTSASSLINFNSGTDVGLSSFLTTGYNPSGSNGDTLTYLTGSSAAGDGINGDLFEFQGSTTLADGTYDFAHDDGMILYLGSDEVINVPGPTAAEETDLCVNAGGTGGCVAAGSYSFTLLYDETSGPPAVLQTDLPLTGPPPVVPEPSSFVLLGSGLLVLAGGLRRRFLTGSRSAPDSNRCVV
ncbi:MAG: PEP-CTERM sorting domain-containing protein [Terracidiphilus sp.]